MRKIGYIMVGFIFVSACCLKHTQYPSPNVYKMFHPEIFMYNIQTGTQLSCLLDSIGQVNNTLDIHIWESTSPKSNMIVVYITEHGCVPIVFINSPPLIGYCKYHTHSCFIYGVSTVDVNSSTQFYLIRDNQKKISIDSIPPSDIISTCEYEKYVFPTGTRIF